MDAMWFYRGICRMTNMCLYPKTVPKNRPEFRRKSTAREESLLRTEKYFE